MVNKLLVVLFIHCNNTCNCNDFMLPDQLEKAFDPMNLLGIETSNLFCSTSVIRIPQKKNFTCPSSKSGKELTSLITKSTSSRLSDTTLFAHSSALYTVGFIKSWNLGTTISVL